MNACKKYSAYTLILLCALVFPVYSQAAELPDFTVLAEEAGSAVVNISTERIVAARQPQIRNFFPQHPQGTPFDDFFQQFDQFFNQPQRAQKRHSLGSGFIISADGYIVTNNHVVAEADVVKVTVHNGKKAKEYTAKIIGTDAETDLALLKITPDSPLAVLKFGDSEALKVGEWVMAIGNPFGLDHSVTVGIISAKNRNIRSGAFDDFLQTDASINPGNSGGPLINGQGEVIGINTAIVASGQGIGFAVPSRLAEDIIAELQKNKQVLRGWIGVTMQNIDEDTAKALGRSADSGALVSSVLPNSPAEHSGLQSGDIIISMNGEKVTNSDDLLRIVASMRPTEKSDVHFLRDGKKQRVQITLGERGKELASQGKVTNDGKSAGESTIGLAVRPVSADEAKQLGMRRQQGLIILTVQENSPAEEVGLRRGDVILLANLKPVNSTRALEKIVTGDAKKRGALLLQIMRQGEIFFVTLNLEKTDK